MNGPQQISGQQIQITNRAIQTAVPVDTTEIPIRRMDWRRIYRKVNYIPRTTSVFAILAATFLGIGTTALLSLIPLYQRKSSQQTEPWLLPTYWAVGLSALILAAAMFFFDRKRRQHIESSCEEVMQDMSEIYECYFPGEVMNESPQVEKRRVSRKWLRLFHKQ